jgi:hypothetical protein
MGREERMVYRTRKRTQNTTTCHNVTVKGGRGEVGAEDVLEERYWFILQYATNMTSFTSLSVGSWWALFFLFSYRKLESLQGDYVSL